MEAHSYGRVERKKDLTSATSKENSPKQDYMESDGVGLMLRKELGGVKNERLNTPKQSCLL